MWNSFCQQPQLKDVHSLRLPDQRISAKPPAPTAARMWHAELAPVGFSVALGVRPQLRRERAIDELAPNILFLSISGFTKILVHDFTIGNPPTDNFCSRIHLRERGRERHTAQTHRDHQENEGVRFGRRGSRVMAAGRIVWSRTRGWRALDEECERVAEQRAPPRVSRLDRNEHRATEACLWRPYETPL